MEKVGDIPTVYLYRRGTKDSEYSGVLKAPNLKHWIEKKAEPSNSISCDSLIDMTKSQHQLVAYIGEEVHPLFLKAFKPAEETDT